ncbi:MAG: cell division protein FtsH, partial [Nitrospiraceae bacterium]
KSMVKTYGMSEKLGQITFDRNRRPLFLQAPQPDSAADYSEETAREIDCEVRRIIDEQHARVRGILEAQEHILREAASVLLGKEVITGDELKAIIGKHPARPTTLTGISH